MLIKRICNTVLLVVVFSLIGGLIGCQTTSKNAKHRLSEITAISISCGNMDRSYGYSFGVHKEREDWILDAECFTHNYETETVIENVVLMSEDVDTLFKILEQSESIAYVENYKKSKMGFFQAKDDTKYSFCLTFSDGSQYATCDRQSEFEELFYHLAEKYLN